MILQRITASLKKRDWETVVLDILIVVVGIFIGLQADDWNQARIDRGLETRYLERFQADLQNNLGRLNGSEYFAKLRMRQVRLLLDGIADPEVAASLPNKFIEAVEKASWESYRPITSNAYAELIGTGRATLIRSDNLRDALAEYYVLIDFWEGILNKSSLFREYSIASAGVLDIDYLAMIQKSGPPTEPPDLGADGGDAISIAEELKSRTQGTRLLPMIYKNHYTVTIAVAELRERNEALQIAIEKYLKGAEDNP